MPDDSVVTLFVDVLGYIGDYQAMVHLLDVTGVAGTSPCNFCTFQRGYAYGSEDASFVEGSSYAYSSAIHSGNMSFRRTESRMQMLRREVSPDKLKDFGLRKMSDNDRQELFLHKLASKLDEKRDFIPLTNSGQPVVSGYIDPYLSRYVAPDHLFYGIGGDICRAMLRLMKPTQRDHANALSVHALAAAGYTIEGTFISNTGIGVNQMAFSSFFTFMLVFPWSVRISTSLETPCRHQLDMEYTSSRDAVLHALFSFQDLFFSMFHVPIESIDGAAAVDALDGKAWHNYLHQMQQLATNYVDEVDGLCRHVFQVRGEIDKPNIHRLLELMYHSLPRLGHASVFQELVLESGHQPLKRGIARSNNHSPYLHAMVRFISVDWKRRLGDVAYQINDITTLTSDDCQSLANVAFGRSDTIDNGIVSEEDIRRGFPSFVLKHLRGMASNLIQMQEKQSYWVCGSIASFVNSDRSVLSFLRVLITHSTDEENLVRYSYATRVSKRQKEPEHDISARTPCYCAKKVSEMVAYFNSYWMKDLWYPVISLF